MIWDTFKHTVDEYKLIREGDRVLAGVSGGQDSVCLLNLLIRLKKQIDFSLAVVHFDHGLRGNASKKDAQFVRQLSEKMGLHGHIVSIPVKEYAKGSGKGIEESARELRYNALEKLSREYGYTRVALGHHRDDQAETVLFRMVRGTGPRGLSGMHMIRRLSGRNVCIIRPLLKIPKKEITGYLKANTITYRTDHTNKWDIFSRNRIRNRLIPFLEKFNPQVKLHMAQLAEIMGDEEQYWAGKIDRTVKKLVHNGGQGNFFLDLRKFNKYHIMIRKRIIQHICGYAADYELMHAVFRLSTTDTTGKRVSVPGFGWVERSYHNLIFRSSSVAKQHKIKAQIVCTMPGMTSIPHKNAWIHGSVLSGKPNNLKTDKNKAFFDWDQLKNRVFSVRCRANGDRFFPFGMRGSKKVKDYCIDRKIPRIERDMIPLLCAGKDIIWLVGHRADSRYHVTKKTKNILELTIEKN